MTEKPKLIIVGHVDSASRMAIAAAELARQVGPVIAIDVDDAETRITNILNLEYKIEPLVVDMPAEPFIPQKGKPWKQKAYFGKHRK